MTEQPRGEPPEVLEPDRIVLEEGVDTAPPKLWGRSTWLSLAFTVALLGVMATLVDFGDVWEKLTAAHWGYILLGGLAHYAAYPVRGERWRRSLAHTGVTRAGRHFGLLVFFYNFVDNLVPAKLGDLYGAHLARINLGIRRSTALGSLAFVRMIDAWVVLGLAGISSYLLFAEALPSWVLGGLTFGAALAVVATGIIATSFLLGRGGAGLPAWLERRLPESITARVASFRTGILPGRAQLLPVAALTAVIWSLEFAWIGGLAAGFDIELTAVELVFLTMIPLLASTVPATPSGAGVVEASLFYCLRAVHVGSPAAAAFTVLNRLIDFWLHIALGVVTWALRDRLHLRTWREPPEQSAALAALALEPARARRGVAEERSRGSRRPPVAR